MKEKIKELFAMLPREMQLELLRELTSSPDFRNPVVEVGAISQQQYGKNIEFTVNSSGGSGDLTIAVLLKTPWGNFEACGANQKIAKAKAAEIALFSINNSSNSNTDQVDF